VSASVPSRTARELQSLDDPIPVYRLHLIPYSARGDILSCDALSKTGGLVPQGVTAHGGPVEPLQFDRLGSRPWPPAPSAFSESENGSVAFMSDVAQDRCGKCGAEIDANRRVDFTLKDGTRVCDACFVKGTGRDPTHTGGKSF
jgi:hypothetical protein